MRGKARKALTKLPETGIGDAGRCKRAPVRPARRRLLRLKHPSEQGPHECDSLRQSSFSGVCNDVGVTVGNITHRVPIWVVDKLGHNLILGRPSSKSSRLQLEDQRNGTCWATLRSPDNSQKVKLCVCQPDAFLQARAYSKRRFQRLQD